MYFLVSWNGVCVKDSSQRLLPTAVNVSSLTPAKCIKACQEKGFKFAGVQIEKECWCGNVVPPEDRIVALQECNYNCQGDSSIKCGGSLRMRVYRIEPEEETNTGIVRPSLLRLFRLFHVVITTLGGSGRVLSEGQGEYSQRVRESTLGGSGRVLSEGQGEYSRRVRESTLGGSGRVLSESQGEHPQRVNGCSEGVMV